MNQIHPLSPSVAPTLAKSYAVHSVNRIRSLVAAVWASIIAFLFGILRMGVGIVAAIGALATATFAATLSASKFIWNIIGDAVTKTFNAFVNHPTIYPYAMPQIIKFMKYKNNFQLKYASSINAVKNFSIDTLAWSDYLSYQATATNGYVLSTIFGYPLRFKVHKKGGILITGSGSGIGAHAALTLAQQGFVIFAGVRKMEDGEKLKKQSPTPGKNPLSLFHFYFIFILFVLFICYV